MRNPPRQRKRTTSSPPCTVEATCITSHQRGNRQHQRANDTHQPEDRHATRSGGQPPRRPPRWHTPSVTDSVTRNDLIYRESASTVKSDSLGHLFIKFFYSLVLGCLAACLLARLIHRSPQIQSLLLGKFAPLLCFFDLVQHLN